MEITPDNFKEEVIDASEKKPVVVDFYADWCGPCKMLGPIMEEIEKEMEGKVKIVKCNVENCQAQAMQYGIMSIPAVKMFENGEVTKEFVGLKPKEDILSWIGN
jgi:thioredoxin 1